MTPNHREQKKRQGRDAVQLWAASALVFGISIMVWAWFGLQPQLPSQARAVDGPSVVQPSASPSSSAPNAAVVPSEQASVALAMYSRRPHYGNKVGTITLPTLHLSWAIYEGTTEKQLARGVGHFRQSVLPGEKNNAVLSGHRTTVFNRLGELHKADQIFVKTTAGVFTYRVRSFSIVKRTSRKVIVPTKTAVLTLTTCWPFDHIGTTTQAFIVRADLVASKLAVR